MRDEFRRVSQIFVVHMFVLLPLFRDLEIPPSSPVDRKDGEQGHGHPKGRCRGDDWQPVCPDSLTLPELGFRGSRRYSRHVDEGCVEGSTAPDASEDLGTTCRTVPLEHIVNQGTRQSVGTYLIVMAAPNRRSSSSRLVREPVTN